jgi:predicted NBD/HSP70 family sugar kinase
MFNSNDLLARIQAGENPDTIADEFAKQLNYAMELDRKQKEAEAAAKKEAEDKVAKLDACVQAMATAMSDYIAIAEPDLVAEIGEGEVIDVKMVRDALDAALAAAKMAVKIAKTFDEPPTPKATKSADDSISQFLKNFGLLN